MVRWMATVTDLIAFLRARLDEDEAVARNISRWPGREVQEELDDPQHYAWRSKELSPPIAQHIVRHGPARTLREVEADRALLAKLCQVEEFGERLRVDTEILILRQVIAIRAAIWNDHPDYEGWLQ